MKIKKKWIMGIVELICLAFGFLLLSLLLQAIATLGEIGYIYLGVFTISLILVFFYEKNLRKEYKIIDKTIEEMFFKGKKHILEQDRVNAEKVRNHLINILLNESFSFKKELKKSSEEEFLKKVNEQRPKRREV